MTHGVLGRWLSDQAAVRSARGVHRELRPRAASDATLDLAGNDYLGLSREPSVIEAAADAARTWGCGATGSRLVTGTTALHQELETALALFGGAGDALAFATGYAANLAVLTSLTDDDTLVISDERNHASIIDGCRLSRAHVVITPHCDVAAVTSQLERRTETRALVVTDAVFSVDGDLAPLAALYDACVRHGAVLVVDEAHALGVVGPGGRGLASQVGIAGEPDVVRTMTLSKSLGAQGGAVLADAAIVAHLVDTARSFIFDTGLAPPAAGAARRALEILEAQPELADLVRLRAAELADALRLRAPEAAVVSIRVGDPGHAVAAARRCEDRGVRIGCFRPPSVPEGQSRLRATVRADLSAADVARAVETIRGALEAVA